MKKIKLFTFIATLILLCSVTPFIASADETPARTVTKVVSSDGKYMKSDCITEGTDTYFKKVEVGDIVYSADTPIHFYFDYELFSQNNPFQEHPKNKLITGASNDNSYSYIVMSGYYSSNNAAYHGSVGIADGPSCFELARYEEEKLELLSTTNSNIVEVEIFGTGIVFNFKNSTYSDSGFTNNFDKPINYIDESLADYFWIEATGEKLQEAKNAFKQLSYVYRPLQVGDDISNGVYVDVKKFVEYEKKYLSENEELDFFSVQTGDNKLTWLFRENGVATGEFLYKNNNSTYISGNCKCIDFKFDSGFTDDDLLSLDSLINNQYLFVEWSSKQCSSGGFTIDISDGLTISSLGEETDIIKSIFYVREADKTAPTFSGIPEDDLIVDVANPITFDLIKAGIKATDNIDGDLTKNIEWTTTYPEDISLIKCQTYTVGMTVQDGNGNEATATFNVKIVDKIAPTITGPSSYSASSSTLLSIDTIKQSLTATDNYDDDLEITVQSDYYTENYQTPGTYYIIFKCEDAAGNSTTHSVEVVVHDAKAPEFKDQDGNVITSTIVNKSPDALLIVTDIIKSLKITDNIDENIKAEVVSDGYTGHGDVVGSYKVVISATDSSRNVTTHNIIINVVSGMPSKTYAINKKIIVVESDNQLEKDDFVSILQVCGYYSDSTTTYIDIDSTTYDEAYNIEGNYLVGVAMTTTSGTAESAIIRVQVIAPKTSDSTVKKNQTNWFVKLMQNIWNVIKSFFDFICKLFTGKLWAKK